MAGDIELGPLDENLATLVAEGRPTNVLVGLILALGNLGKSLQKEKIISIEPKEFING